MRKTKIIATLGPATDSAEMIGRLIEGGVNVFRLNMSHATHDWVRRVVNDIRSAATRTSHTGIIMDTQGPAIRTGDLGVPLDLQPGQKFTLTVRGERSEEVRSVDVNYEDFVNDINVGDVVLIDNGAIQMKVLAKSGNKVDCEVLTEGKLGSRRHINLPGVKVSLPALTGKDLADEDAKFIRYLSENGWEGVVGEAHEAALVTGATSVLKEDSEEALHQKARGYVRDM